MQDLSWITGAVNSGIMSLNELREKLNRDMKGGAKYAVPILDAGMTITPVPTPPFSQHIAPKAVDWAKGGVLDMSKVDFTRYLQQYGGNVVGNVVLSPWQEVLKPMKKRDRRKVA